MLLLYCQIMLCCYCRRINENGFRNENYSCFSLRFEIKISILSGIGYKSGLWFHFQLLDSVLMVIIWNPAQITLTWDVECGIHTSHKWQRHDVISFWHMLCNHSAVSLCDKVNFWATGLFSFSICFLTCFSAHFIFPIIVILKARFIYDD